PMDASRRHVRRNDRASLRQRHIGGIGGSKLPTEYAQAATHRRRPDGEDTGLLLPGADRRGGCVLRRALGDARASPLPSCPGRVVEPRAERGRGGEPYKRACALDCELRREWLE